MIGDTVRRFAAGNVRTGKDGIYIGTGPGQRIKHGFLYGYERRPVKDAATDTSLIGHDDAGDIVGVRTSDDRRCPRRQFHILNFVQIVHFFDDDPVTIQKQRRAAFGSRNSGQNLAPDTVFTDFGSIGQLFRDHPYRLTLSHSRLLPGLIMLHPMQPSKADNEKITDIPAPTIARQIWLRWLLIGAGWMLIGIGIIGIFVPVLPTTVFMIAALWAFSRSSRRFQRWLWLHPTFGPPVRDWHHYGVIPIRGKVLAVIVMSLSFVYVTVWVAEDWQLPALVGAIMLPAALYIITRRSRPPDSGI